MGNFRFIETKIPDLYIIEPNVFGDNRGFLIGPVVPIYGTGGILITILLKTPLSHFRQIHIAGKHLISS